MLRGGHSTLEYKEYLGGRLMLYSTESLGDTILEDHFMLYL